MRSCLLCIALSLGFLATAQAGDKTVPRYLEFRDGSLLRLQVVDEPCTITVVRNTGRIEPLTVNLSSLATVSLTSEQDFAQKKALLSAVQQLGAEDFRVREQAFAALARMGARIRPDLEACQQLTTDPETLARLNGLLARLPKEAAGNAKPIAAFDRLQLKEAVWGYLGDRGIPVHIDGVTHRLSRKDVAGMSVEPPGLFGLSSSPAVPHGFQRIRETDFPPGCIEEAFEQTPEGRPLRIGENIEKLFLAKGFVLSTSVTTSFVSVNNFVVQGKSRGLSAATHLPLWTGEVTIKFVQPNNERVAAGVSHFGCYIAAVVPNGTALVAYGLDGRELGTIHTEKNNTDFLGVRSSVPIHRIKIVPNLALDPDYTLDDFIFTPVRTDGLADPTKYVVYLSGGDRVLCRDATFSREGLRLHGLPGGLPDRTCSTAAVRRINAPRPDQNAAPTVAAGVFAELRDGSLLYGAEAADKHGQPVFARRPKLLQEKDQLAGLWNTTFPRLTPDAKAGKVVVWNDLEKRWQDLSWVRLLEEVVLWKGGGDQMESAGYRKLPPLWLTAPSAGPVAGSWHLRTIQGEDLVLAGADTIAGPLSKEFQVVWQGQPVRVSAAEVLSIYRAEAPPKP